ncbi:ligand-binding sensor domain-containing protein [Confluentibacter lentus]|uniref:ligand-binding sensor domain-containing protein n=1 Tax=Confluentibacter lentus TaxID=1699412 RepID=UPI000C285BFA|nr:two-component regulator propeller domain-containing protein [Confluentibacter lentus]
MKYTHAYPLFIMLVFCASCEGQNKKTDLSKDNINSESKGSISPYGPTSSVRTIIQDKQGNIWLASNEGIIRYDGKTFTNITGNLGSDRFFSVLQDKNENFWFGNYGSGVYYYNGKSLQHFTTKEGLINNRISSIYEDKVGNIWFGANGGASRYDGKSFRNYIMEGNSVIEDSTGKSFPNLSSGSNGVNPIFEDKTGKLWFGTNGNTFIYDGKIFNVVSNKEGRTFTNVWSIIQDKKGNIWLGGDGFWRYDPSAVLRTGPDTFTNFTENSVRYVYEDKRGNIWGSGSINGRWALFRFDEKSLSDKKPTVIEITESLNLFGIFEANDRNIWFGSFDGVYRYDGKTITDFKSK